MFVLFYIISKLRLSSNSSALLSPVVRLNHKLHDIDWKKTRGYSVRSKFLEIPPNSSFLKESLLSFAAGLRSKCKMHEGSFSHRRTQGNSHLMPTHGYSRKRRNISRAANHDTVSLIFHFPTETCSCQPLRHNRQGPH